MRSEDQGVRRGVRWTAAAVAGGLCLLALGIAELSGRGEGGGAGGRPGDDSADRRSQPRHQPAAHPSPSGSFDAPLRALAERFCARATTAGRCDPQRLARACQDPTAAGELESAFQAFGPEIEAWIQSLPFSTRSPSAEVREGFAGALRRLAFDDMAPASTFVAVGVVLLAKDVAPDGLMREIVSRAPASCSVAAWQAYAALGVTATDADMPFLLEQLRGGTPGQKRAAFVALGRVPAARQELAGFLRSESAELEQGLALRLPRALAASGLVRDHELVGDLLREGNANAREATLKAVGRVEDRQRPEALVSSLESIVDRTSSGGDEHAAALMALGASGAGGERRLVRLSRDPNVDLGTRLQALESLSSDRDPEVPMVALELIPSCRSVWEIQTAIELAVEDEARRPELVAAIERWCLGHPALADELRQELRSATQPEVRTLSQ